MVGVVVPGPMPRRPSPPSAMNVPPLSGSPTALTCTLPLEVSIVSTSPTSASDVAAAMVLQTAVESLAFSFVRCGCSLEESSVDAMQAWREQHTCLDVNVHMNIVLTSWSSVLSSPACLSPSCF